jgi:hypothetical protein
MGLQQFERRLERLVEGAFAKAFRSGLQPVELARRLTREMDLQRTVGVRGMIAPNVFTFELATEDLDRFASFSDTLAAELATEARDHARGEGYNLVGPVEIELVAGMGLTAGTVNVIADVVEGETPPAGAVVLPDGRRVEVTGEGISIGRLASCDVVLEDDLEVSRKHAEVRINAGRAFVVDLGSRNGTKVNGAGVKERALSDGDQVTVGVTTLRYEAP